MPIKMQVPVSERVFLVRADERLGNEGEPTYVEVRQARIIDTERRADITSKRTIKQQVGDSQISVETRFNFPEVMRFDVQMTLCGCNIVGTDGEDLFRFTRSTPPSLDMSDNEFMRAWRQLDDETAQEIHDAVMLVNPNWDATLDGADDENF